MKATSNYKNQQTNQNGAQSTEKDETSSFLLASGGEWLRGKDISEFCMAYMKDSKIQMDSLLSVQKLLSKAIAIPNAFVIRRNRLGINSAMAISRILQEKEHLLTLDLHENVIRDNGCIALCDNLLSHDSCNIEYLDIGSNDLTNRGVEHLANFIASPNCHLKVLILGSSAKDMYGNKYDSAIGAKLCQNVQKFKTLQHINLNRNTQLGAHSQQPFKAIASWFTRQRNSQKYSEESMLNIGIQSIDDLQKGDSTLRIEEMNNKQNKIVGDTDTTIIYEEFDDEEEEEKYLRILEAAHRKLIKEQSQDFLEQDAKYSDVIPQTNSAKDHEFNTQIHTLKVAFCAMQDTSFISIIQNALYASYYKLRELDVSGNNLSADISPYLSQYLSHPACRLEILHLSHNQIGDRGIASLVPGIVSNSSLMVLKLDHNEIGESGTQLLADVIRQSVSIRHLDLEANNISTIGCIKIAESLNSNTTLHTLKLGKNKIQDEGVIAIGESLQHHESLIHITLNSCSIGDKGAFSLVAALGMNRSLRIINLKSNHLTVDSGKAFFEILSKNHEVTHIDLRGNQIDHATQMKIRRLLSQNKLVKKSRNPESLKREVIRLKYCALLLENARITYKEEVNAREHAENEYRTFKDMERVKREKLIDLINQTNQNIAVEHQTLTEIEDKINISKMEHAKFIKECEERIVWLEDTIQEVSKLYTKKETEIADITNEISTKYSPVAQMSLENDVKVVKEEAISIYNKKLDQEKLIQKLKEQLSEFETIAS